MTESTPHFVAHSFAPAARRAGRGSTARDVPEIAEHSRDSSKGRAKHPGGSAQSDSLQQPLDMESVVRRLIAFLDDESMQSADPFDY
jgi:hypothetical protein